MSHSRFVVRVALGCALLSPIFTQLHRADAAPSVNAPSIAPSANLHIAIKSEGNTVTFKPEGGVSALRVKITGADGTLLFNSGWRTGFDVGPNTLNWQALDDQGALLPAGVYLTQVEARGVDGTTQTESGSLQLEAPASATRSNVTPRATNVTGGGTTNRIVLWTSASTIGDSIITQTASNAISVAGIVNAVTVNATNATGNALVGNSTNATALAGITKKGNGVLGVSDTSLGVRGVTGTGIGVRGDSNNGTTGVQGNSTAANNNSAPVGVEGIATGSSSSIGVRGKSSSGGTGVIGYSPGFAGMGVVGQVDNGYAIYGYAPKGYAGYFAGNVNITGNLAVVGTITKGGGSFRIDDPTDPANKYLSHSFVESPDMMNIYNGTVTLDKKGRATVTMPSYFAALNRDFRYQLTCIGGWAPVYVARKINGNTWQIAGGKTGLEVSWQVTGVRRDPWANDHRIPTQQLKTGAERGRYLYPVGYGKPESLSLSHVLNAPGPAKAASKPVLIKAKAPAKVKGEPSAVKPVRAPQGVQAAQRVVQAAR